MLVVLLPLPVFAQLSAVDYTNQGLAKYDQGDLDGALANFNQAISLDPNYGPAYFSRANVKTEDGDSAGALADYDQAIEIYNRAIAADSNNATTFYNRGLAKYNKGDLPGAIADFDRALALDPKDEQAALYRALALYHIGQIDAAIAGFTQVISLNPKNAQAYYYRGLAKLSKGDMAGAQSDYDMAFSLDPTLSKSNYTQVSPHNGPEDSDSSPGTAVNRLDPKLAAAYYTSGVSKKRKGDLDGAIADLTRAVSLNPNFAKAYFVRANAKKNKGRFTDSLPDYDQSLKLNPMIVKAYVGRGNSKYNLGNWNGAAEDYRSAIKLVPATVAYPRFYLYCAQAHAGQESAARKELADYLAQRPSRNSSDSASRIGAFLTNALSESEFLDALNTKDAPKKSQVPICEGYYYAGMKRLLAGDKTTAIAYFQKSVATHLRNYRAYNMAQAELWNLPKTR